MSGMYYNDMPCEGDECEECGFPIRIYGTAIDCENGCFDDDTRNYLTDNYR